VGREPACEEFSMFGPNTTIRDIVADDFRAASVFQRHRIDFCCGGDRPVGEACRQQGVDERALVEELEAVTSTPGDVPRFNAWDLDFLAAYIVTNHHAYVRRAVETIGAHTQKVASVHGDRHPETLEIARHFAAVAEEMTQHMLKEERMLFPYVTSLAEAARSSRPAPSAPFGTVANPIRMMEMEHRAAGDALAAIRRLSRDFAPPDDACTTYRVTYKELEEFETDLHRHVHLENNVLFPKALELERALAASR
jgi:regulator of cell morphogenesis and NO signaling